jgi:Apea-like HEPN
MQVASGPTVTGSFVTTREHLISEIARWLEDERRSCAAAARELGFPPSVPHSFPTATNVSEDSLGLEYREVDVSSTTIPGTLHTIREGSRQSPRPTSPAASIWQTYGEKCMVWTLQPAGNIASESWIESFLLEPILADYLRGLASLDEGNRQTAIALATGLLELVESDDVTLVTGVPVAGIRFDEDQLVLGDVTARRLSAEELGKLLHAHVPTVDSIHSRRQVVPVNFIMTPERWALELRTRCSKKEQPQPTYFPARLLLALQLLGFELHGVGQGTQWTEPDSNLYQAWPQYRLPMRGSTRQCTTDELERAVRLAQKIPDEVFVMPRSSQEVALHRFLTGASADEAPDALIDYVISLEAALLQKDQELSLRLSLYGAAFLATDPLRRRSLFDKLRQLYSVRSDLVHGSKVPSPDDVSVASRDGRELAAAILVKALEQGWPSRVRLLELAIGPLQ